MATMNLDEVETKFRDAFEGTRITRYNQAAENPNTVGNGLCTGLCLNWARQTVVTERSRWWMLLETKDAVRAQAGFDQDRITETAQGLLDKKLAAIDKKRADASSDFFAAKNTINRKLGSGSDGVSAWDGSTDPRIRQFVAEKVEMKRTVDAECDRMTKKVQDRALHVQWHWKAFCASMVDEMKVKGTDYSDMVLEHVAAQTDYAGSEKQGGLKALFTSVVSEPSLGRGRVACVGRWEVSGKTQGHMVGVFHQTPGVYHVFDPNIGVWEFKKERLVEAAAWLFFEAYPKLGSCPDKGTYERNNKAKAEYLIFSRKAGERIEAIHL
jgi:hypothetical protein